MDWQGVHIGDRRAIAGPKYANHARLADVAMNLATELLKLAGDELGRAMLLEAKLGMGVKVVAPTGHVSVIQIDKMWNLHGERLHGMLKFEATLRRALK
jgi:hypothetical protein